MWCPYKDAISLILPHAKQIVDKFHVIKYGSKAMKSTCKAFRSTLTDTRRKQLMHDKFIFLKNKEDLKPQEQWHLQIWFTTFPILKLHIQNNKSNAIGLQFDLSREELLEFRGDLQQEWNNRKKVNLNG